MELHADVTFSWLMGDGTKMAAEPKDVTVNAGASKIVFFTAPANLNSVSVFQAHPNYGRSSNCKTKATITG
ncbi:MAG: hypothetical protein WD739_10945 [Actinomycetota bacterium]